MTPMRWRTLLLGILGLATLLEAAFPVMGFSAPAFMLSKFQMTANDDTLMLAHVIAWALLFVTVVCAMSWYFVRRRHASGWTLSYLLGAWWMGIGTSLAFVFHRPEHLVLDALKGALILTCAYGSRSLAGDPSHKVS